MPITLSENGLNKYKGTLFFNYCHQLNLGIMWYFTYSHLLEIQFEKKTAQNVDFVIVALL